MDRLSGSRESMRVSAGIRRTDCFPVHGVVLTCRHSSVCADAVENAQRDCEARHGARLGARNILPTPHPMRATARLRWYCGAAAVLGRGVSLLPSSEPNRSCATSSIQVRWGCCRGARPRAVIQECHAVTAPVEVGSRKVRGILQLDESTWAMSVWSLAPEAPQSAGVNPRSRVPPGYCEHATGPVK